MSTASSGEAMEGAPQAPATHDPRGKCRARHTQLHPRLGSKLYLLRLLNPVRVYRRFINPEVWPRSRDVAAIRTWEGDVAPHPAHGYTHLRSGARHRKICNPRRAHRAPDQ